MADERILERLDDSQPLRANEIRDELATHGSDMDYPQRYIDRRLDRLEAYGLVQRNDDRWAYSLTNRGDFYLRGEFDASVLHPDKN